VEINKYIGDTAFDVFVDRITVEVSQKRITCPNDSDIVGAVEGANRPYVRHIRVNLSVKLTMGIGTLFN